MTNKISKFISPTKQYSIFNSVDIVEKDPLPENVDLTQVIQKIESLLPRYMFHAIDVMYIGYFEEMQARSVNAMYKDGALYLTNEQSDNSDMIDDIVHEISHSLEEIHGAEIYADNSVESEFLMKRKKLESILRNHGIDTSGYNFLETDYSIEFDNYLYQDVGYPKLNTLSQGIFSSAYGVTSLREYFANGFEEFYLGDRRYLSKTCPKLYNKINELNALGEQYV
tara:strand:+ start:3520 stop:4194 length:675 start_codon:yes stop_codon:yes gene_type:complete